MKERIAGELPHGIVEESLEGQDYTSGFRFEDEILTVYETKPFPRNDFRGFIPLGVAAGLVNLLLIQVIATGASEQSLEMLAFFAFAYVPMTAAGVVFLVKDYRRSGTRVSLDRRNGVLLFRTVKREIRAPFAEVRGFLVRKRGFSGYMLALSIPDATNGPPLLFMLQLPLPGLYLWSLMEWFMDSSRPLPPGELFDPAR